MEKIMREIYNDLLNNLWPLAVVAAILIATTGCSSVTLREEDMAAAVASLSITQGDALADKISR